MNAITKTTLAIEHVLKEEETDTSNLIPLINTNHRLLEAINIGVEITDKIVAIAHRHKVGCKITGAGFGGCILAVYSANSDVKGFRDEIKALKEDDVSIIQAEFSKTGLQCDSWEHA